MLHKFTDWPVCNLRSVLFTNVCTLMHNLQFARNTGQMWSFEHVYDSREEVFAEQLTLKLNCRLDNIHCKLYFLLEDISFFIRRYYDVDVSLVDRALQRSIWKQAIYDLLPDEQNIFTVEDVNTQTISPAMLKSNRKYVTTFFDLFIEKIRLRGLLKLSDKDVDKWYRFYQKYYHYVKNTDIWQDIPMVFSVILGSTEFAVADFLYDRYQIRENDVIIIENTPPQDCVWIDIGGYLLLARYEQQKFILSEEIIMPEDTKSNNEMDQNNTGQDDMPNTTDPSVENPTSDDSGGSESSEDGDVSSENEDGTVTGEDGSDPSVENATSDDSGSESSDDGTDTDAADTASDKDQNLTDNLSAKTPNQANVKLPQVSTDKLSRTSLNTAIKKISVRVVFELSRVQILLSELQKLNKGYVFNLHQRQNSSINIIVNDKIIAYGELVKISDSLGVRITKVF